MTSAPTCRTCAVISGVLMMRTISWFSRLMIGCGVFEGTSTACQFPST